MNTAIDSLAASLPSPACAWIWEPARLRERAAQVRAALPQATVLYAMKACANPGVLAAAVEACDGIECASAAEAAAALDAGAARIALSGPAKTAAETHLAAEYPDRVLVHAESVTELQRLAEAAFTGPVALRVGRGPALPGTHQMTGKPTPFGLDPGEVNDAADTARRLGLDVVGFHMHAVSNCLDAPAYAAHVAGSHDWARTAAGAAGIELRYLNIGGGLGADPRGDLIDLDLLADLLSRLDTGDVELVIEPGRYLAAAAGWYLTEVTDLKTVGGQAFALVRGGTHHFRLPAAWGYAHPFTIIATGHWPHSWERPRLSGVDLRVCGELCTPNDVLNSGQRVETVAVGDRLLFADAGAYGWEISHDRFLQHARPLQITIDGPD